MEHILKILPQYYADINKGIKTFEIRKNDRDYRVGDTLLLCEWNTEQKNFTGNSIRKEVTYILRSNSINGLNKNYIIMAIR